MDGALIAESLRAGATPDTKYVVFAGRSFRFRRDDEAANREAQEYARSVGVPDTQIDWAR
jgi:hypothetical protein